MKVMVMVKATKSSEAGVMPSQELLAAMGQFNEELVKAGIMLQGEGLHPTSKGVRVRFSGKERAVIDGPFAETNELVAGFWMWQVKSMQEAVDWVKRCPNPMLEDSEIEIRPVITAEDFGEHFTPELRQREAILHAEMLGLKGMRFEDAPDRLLAGLSASFTIDTEQGIPELWQKFVPHLGKIPGQVGSDTYGVASKPTADGRFDYLAGVEVSDASKLPKEFTTLKVAGGRYAVVPHVGHASKLKETFETLCKRWLPDSGVKVRPGPWLERYTSEFNPVTMSGGTTVWIPVEA